MRTRGMRVLPPLLDRTGMMFCGTLHEFFCFLVVAVIVYCTSGEILPNKNDEYVRSDFRMCLDSFDVHKNKIIQTQDSREMGAKYLNETEVNTREECLAFCCKTERCDVFIFEEKKPGSCYLFQCGPLHDFKCKFTSHANYTSAVRTSYNTQEEELRISQQEHELKSLRKLADSSPEYTAFTIPAIKSIVTQTSKLMPTTPMPVKKGCSRNQYECRSSGECIAIYNVCDGIPQCTDGSDEAAELVCPTDRPTVVPQIAIQHPLMPQLPSSVLKYQQILDQRKPIPPFIYPHGIENNPRTWELTNSIHPMISQQQSLMYPAQQVEVPDLRKNFGPQGYQWNYQPLYEQAKENYKIPNSYQETANVNIYDQDQSHIPAHQEPSVVDTSDLNGSEGILSDPNHSSHLPVQNAKTLQRNHIQLPPTVTVTNNEKKKSNIVQEPIKTTTAVPCEVETISKNKEPTKTDQEKNKDADLQKISNHNEEKPSLPNTNLKHSHQQSSENKDYKNKASVINDNTKERHITTITGHLRLVHEEENLRPKGAVVSLALGLTVTAITAALIACRLRVVRRRSRRGQGPYAHDADYLVNGMYL